MFDEMGFLFETSRQISNQFNTNQDASRKDLNTTSQVKNTNNSAQSATDKIEYNEKEEVWKFNKYTITNTSIKNYIKSSVNAAYGVTGKNPYVDLLETFSGDNTKSKALKIKASDLVYLRDIGVYPINRLMILRRYPEGTVVPIDLMDLPVEPISTVIGWVKPESELLSFQVNEVWKTQSKWLHVLAREIIQKEFGFDIGAIFPVPGWGTGFMFGLLKDMGLTDYSSTDLPIGDPNLLREGVTRAHEEQGLMSNFTFNIETVYEQKYIAGIDAGAAINDILENALAMGTSNIRFLGKAGTKVTQQITEANNNPSNPEGWKQLMETVITSVINSLNGIIKDTIRKEEAKPVETETETTDTSAKKKSKATEAAEGQQEKLGLVQGFISKILASTVARYQWPIRGALNQLTGEAATPWHLTIGNPYAPLLSMNNLKVTSLDVSMGNELSYNDMPRYMTLKVNLEQGRNLGKQEIENMFGVEYKREYKKV